MFFARIFFRIEQIHVFGYPQGKIPFNNPSHFLFKNECLYG